MIAIIGILSAVVYVALSGGRNKGHDAAIKGGMHELLGQIESYYENNGNNYGPTFASATCPTAV